MDVYFTLLLLFYGVVNSVVRLLSIMLIIGVGKGPRITYYPNVAFFTIPHNTVSQGIVRNFHTQRLVAVSGFAIFANPTPTNILKGSAHTYIVMPPPTLFPNSIYYFSTYLFRDYRTVSMYKGAKEKK